MKKAVTVLVIGASRGIGHALVRQYRDEGATVHATCRNDAVAGTLRALGCTAHRLDVVDAGDWSSFGGAIASIAFDIAIHNAGVGGPRGEGPPSREDFDDTMRTNVWAAMLMTPVVAPRVAATRGKLVVISSRMGSIGARTDALHTVYRASKAAVNSVMKDAAITYGPQGLTCVAMHPGWVRTAMGGSGADLDVADSAKGIRKTISGLTPDDNGCFFNYDGAPMRW